MITKADKKFTGELTESVILLVCKSMQRFDKSLQKDIKVYRKQQLDIITLGDL